MEVFKFDSIDLMRHITLLDLNAYMKAFQKDFEKERKNSSNKHIMECLKGVSDYLNMLFYKK